MTAADAILELQLSRRPDVSSVPVAMVHRQKSAGAAFTLACTTSGLDDKEIYLSIGIDAGTFSRIKKGEATLQADKLQDFCKQVGNTIYPEWLAYQVGCTLVMIQTEAERKLVVEREAREKAEAENRLLRDILQGRK